MATAKKTPSGTWRVQIFLGKDKDGVNILSITTSVGTVQANEDGDLFDPNETPDFEGNRIIMDCYEAFNWLTGVRLFY